LVTGFPAAKYKSFPTREEAEKAFQQGREYYYQPKQKPNLWKSRATLPEIPFIKESIAVDAACSGNPGVLEYRGVDLQTGQEIFHQHFEIGTNNIGEFLAIAH
jgi:ribonuclease HI